MRRLPFWALVTAVFLPLWWMLTARLWFVVDDAWISFRFSRHWAQGHGPRYNLGDDLPVEGYSNFLWVALAAVVERMEQDPGVVMPALSALCGAVLLAWVTRTSQVHLGMSRAGTVATAAFLAASPAFAAWSTGGLATMPAALAMFVLADRLLFIDGKGLPVGALVAGACLSLLRTEGPAWVVIIVLLALYVRWRRRDVLGPRWYVRPLGVLAVVGALVAVHIGWRYQTYGDVVSHTARAKVGMSTDRLWRGMLYVLGTTVNLVTPALGLVAIPATLRVADARGVAIAALVVGVPAYTVAVGGDYMAFGRMLVTGLPFVALALGAWTTERRWRMVPTLLVVALGILPGVGLEISSSAVRKALVYRNTFPKLDTEYRMWDFMRRNALAWEVQGRTLAAATEPGEGMVTGAIGARGYFSDLHIYDRGGLVVREVTEQAEALDPLEHSPGHDRTVERAFFLPQQPTYLDWTIVRTTMPVPKMVKEVDRMGRRYADDGYGPRARRVTVDGVDKLVILLARAEGGPQEAATWWDGLSEHLEAVAAGPIYGVAPPPR